MYQLRLCTFETWPIHMEENWSKLDARRICIGVNDALTWQYNASYVSRLLILLNFTSLSEAGTGFWRLRAKFFCGSGSGSASQITYYLVCGPGSDILTFYRPFVTPFKDIVYLTQFLSQICLNWDRHLLTRVGKFELVSDSPYGWTRAPSGNSACFMSGMWTYGHWL